MKKVIMFYLFFVGAQAYGQVMHVEDLRHMSPDIAQQLEIISEEKYNIKRKKNAIEKAGAIIEKAKEALMKAESDINTNELNKEKAEADRVAAEIAKEKAEEDIEAAEHELQEASAKIPKDGICVPVIYPSGSCYQYMRDTREWYFHMVGCDEDVLSAECRSYFSRSREALEKNKKEKNEEVRKNEEDQKNEKDHFAMMRHKFFSEIKKKKNAGHFAMIEYSLQARIDEERYDDCQKNKKIIQRVDMDMMELNAAKQRSIEEIGEAVNIIDEAIKNIRESRVEKQLFGLDIIEAEDVIEKASIDIEVAKKKIEVASVRLDGLRGVVEDEL